MTATERLRQLLDKWGVEWEALPDQQEGDFTITATQWHDGEGGLLTMFISEPHGSTWDFFWLPTPEQAIAATLGNGTCKAIISDNLTESEGTGDAWADCSECGHLLYVLTDPNSEPPNYCPNCGRKVVDE